MPDALGWRKKFAVLAPSTNTIVEPETYLMAVPGVTAHVSRIFCPVPDLSSNDANVRFLEQIRANIQEAIDRAVTCEPDYLIMGLSAETFWGGKEGCEALKRRLKDMSGLESRPAPSRVSVLYGPSARSASRSFHRTRPMATSRS